MLRERLFIALLVSAGLICSVGFAQPDDNKDEYKAKWFWSWKTNTKRKYDIVVLGDSRIYRGISPVAMQELIPSAKILNFGYSSGSFSPRMLYEAEKRLNRYGMRIIILGVSPHTLTPRAARDEHFLQEKNRNKSEIIGNLYFSPLLKFFRPTTPVKIIKGFHKPSIISNATYYQEYSQDGWVASWKYPEDPQEALIPYLRDFTNNMVSSALIANLIRQTGDWAARGIKVYAFRPPTSNEMVELERGHSGFDEGDFVSKFSRAGGIWISIPLEGYHSYDGSHLDKMSAVALSRTIAEVIRKSSRFPSADGF
jgi:hypothetical protein